MNTQCGTVKSSDGCSIAFEVEGSGPIVMLVDGALCSRRLGPSKGMSNMLINGGFRVVRYDRRGRGQSGSQGKSSPQKEVDDIAAIGNHIGEDFGLWGMSSGGHLALLAASQLSSVRKVAVYEVPALFDNAHPPLDRQWREIRHQINSNEPEKALNAFLTMVGMPAPARAVMRLLPIWRTLTLVAPTLGNDGDIVERYLEGTEASLNLLPTLKQELMVTAGSRSPDWLVSNNKRLATHYPRAKFITINGDDHMARPRKHAAILKSYFGVN